MPKRVGHLYTKMLDTKTIKHCIIKGSKGKKKRHDVRIVLRDPDKYARKVLKLLRTETYVPTIPRKKTIYDKSCGKERDIKIVPYYPDGIIQQLAVYAMKDVLMRGMYAHSCASIPGRGNMHAARYAKKHLRNDKRGTKYCCKMDIRHYYPTISKRRLMDALERKTKDRRFLKLVESIIYSDPEQGLSIGFYINQWLANFYLERLDHFITALDGVDYYVRNMDDLVLMGPNKRKLHRARESIERFMQTIMGLEMKRDWQIFPVDARGIDFVGYRFYHNRTTFRRRNFRKLRRNVRTAWKFLKINREIPYHVAAGLLSRAGQLKHCNSCKVYEKYIHPIGEKRLKQTARRHMLTERRVTHEIAACNT